MYYSNENDHTCQLLSLCKVQLHWQFHIMGARKLAGMWLNTVLEIDLRRFVVVICALVGVVLGIVLGVLLELCKSESWMKRGAKSATRRKPVNPNSHSPSHSLAGRSLLSFGTGTLKHAKALSVISTSQCLPSQTR